MPTVKENEVLLAVRLVEPVLSEPEGQVPHPKARVGVSISDYALLYMRHAKFRGSF